MWERLHLELISSRSSEDPHGRNPINVACVVRASVRPHIFKPIRESILERNHTNVLCVVRALVRVHVFRFIRESMMVINPLIMMSVIEVLFKT